MRNGKRVVLTYGTYDLFHVGHLNLLERARALGDELIVAVSTDEFNATKGKRAFFAFEDRRRIVEACRFVDQTIPENDWQQKEHDIKKYQVDIFVMGDDWRGKFDSLSNLCEVVYLERTPGISSTQLKSMSKEYLGHSIASDLAAAGVIINDVLTKISDLK